MAQDPLLDTPLAATWAQPVRSHYGLAAGLLLVALALSACGSAAATSAGSAGSAAPSVAGSRPAAAAAAGNPYLGEPGAQPVPVKVAWCNPSGGFMQLYVARDTKLFTKYGLDVSASLVNGSDPSLAALQSGQLDFVYCAAAATIPGMVAGVDAVLIAAPLVGLPFTLVARPDFVSVQDLKGRTIGVSQAGDLLDRLGHDMLKHFNMPADAVNLRPLGGQAQEYQALKAGGIDGAILSAPLDAQAVRDGMKVVFQFRDLGVPFVYSAVHTNSKTIRARPKVVQSFVAAMAEALQYTESHKAEAEQSLAKELKLTDQFALDAAYDAYTKDIVNRDMLVPVAAVRDTIDYVREHGLNVNRSKAEDLIDNRFAEDLRTSGFLDTLWIGRSPSPPK